MAIGGELGKTRLVSTLASSNVPLALAWAALLGHAPSMTYADHVYAHA